MTNRTNETMSVMDAIYGRRSVRDYTAQKVDEATLHVLLYAATQAPTGLQAEPWAFAVIQDRGLLDRLSETARQVIWLKAPGQDHSGMARNSLNIMSDPSYNLFHNAGTLIVIYGRFAGPFVAADCWLAAENLMLAACAAGLGTCVTGLAAPVLNTPEWKNILNVPDGMSAYAPITVGYPAALPVAPPRQTPELLCWR